MLSISQATSVALLGLAVAPALALTPSVVQLASGVGTSLFPSLRFTGTCRQSSAWNAAPEHRPFARFSAMEAAHVR